MVISFKGEKFNVGPPRKPVAHFLSTNKILAEQGKYVTI